MKVKKKNGTLVDYNPSKINSFLEKMVEGIDNVSMSDIIMASNLSLYDGISTSEMNNLFIESASNLISVETPNYDLVAGRISVSEVRKSAYGDFEPDDLKTILVRNTFLGIYDPEILKNFSDEEIEEFDLYIDHDRDMNISISGIKEWQDKYLCKNKITNQFFESPQISYILMAMSNFMYDPGNQRYSRMQLIKLRYEHLSMGLANSPTPQNAGLRTPTRNFSSCVLIEIEDSINGISAGERAAKKYATLKAGLGIGTHGLRATNQKIRNGEAINTGVIHHAKSIELSAISCSQGGVRKGSCTFNWLGWHLDFEDIIRYKNGAKPEDESMRHSDHSIMINGYLWYRALHEQDIWLFSPEEVPELYDSFFSDSDKFEVEYEKAILKDGISKKKISGQEWIMSIVLERIASGRVYILWMDNTNKYSAFIPSVAPVRMSNLCVEINQHTKPVTYIQNDDGSETMDGLIALCNLGGTNFGFVNTKEEMEELCYVSVRALDNLLDLQEYPFKASRDHNELYRPIGIGITGLAYWLAKNGLKYDNCYELLDEWVDYWSYCIIKASMELSEERGPCKGFDQTKWSQGILPVDIYPEELNEVYESPKRDHWDYIRENITKVGIRNATLMAIMPAETSAKVSGRGTTNGVEPVRALIVQKGGKSSKGRFVVPELTRLKDKYDIVWNWTGWNPLLKTYALMQKYIDQAISVNSYYYKVKYDNGKIPINQIIKDLTLTHKYGLKSVYYNNNNDDNDDLFSGTSTDNHIAIEESTTDCEACKL